MTTWNSRIILRHDGNFVIDDVANAYATIGRGEVAFAIDSAGRVSGRIGVRNGGMPWNEAPEVFAGGTIKLPLSVEIPEGSGLEDGAILRWDPDTSRFVADVEPIGIGTDQTGALNYDATGDAWSIDTSTFIPATIDGGAFIGGDLDSPVAPSFVTEPSFTGL